MPLTRSFKATVQARVEQDPAFREALLAESVDALLAGDLDGGKAVLQIGSSACPSHEPCDGR